MENTTNDKSRSWALITGASSGIGYELAKVFAKNNFNLLITAENNAITEAGNTFRSMGVAVEAFQTDLAKPDGVDKLYEKIKNLDQPLECAVLNAGVGVGGAFASTDFNKELNVIQLNIISVVKLAKYVVQDMLPRGQGRILFTSSVAAELPGPYNAVYAASKAFVQSFAEAIRVEVIDSGITVTALQPGATDTNFFARAEMLDTKAGQSKKDSAAQVAEDGFKALMAGKDHVVAGSFKNVIQATTAKFISDAQGAKMQGKETKPISH